MNVVLHYLGEMGGVMLLALPPWLLLRTLWLLAKKQSPRWGRELLLAALALYLAGLASQTLSTPVRVDLTDLPALWARALQRWQEGLAVNLVPGRTIRAFWQRGSQTQQLVNLAGNVAVFLPLGFLPPLLWRRWRHWWTALALSGGVSCLIEFLQLFLGRSVDVDDVLLNVLGGFLGYLLFCLLPQKLKNR